MSARETWSPNWANTWVADVPGIEQHIGRCLLVASRARRVLAVGDSAAPLHRDYEKATLPSRRLMVEAVKLTTDDEPGKVYRYLAPDTKVVYYALSETTNVIKIGTSKDVRSRIDSLATEWHGPWRVLAVEPGSYDVETRRHEEFSSYWIAPTRRKEGRELFQPGPRLMQYIRSLVHRPVGLHRRAEVRPLSTRLVLNERLPDLEYRPRLNTEVDLDLLRRYSAIASAREQSIDEVVQAALVAYLPVMEQEATPSVPMIEDPVYGEGLIGPPEDPDLGDQELFRRIARKLARVGEDPPERPVVDEPEPESAPARPSFEWTRGPEPAERDEPASAPRDVLAVQVQRARDALTEVEPERVVPEPVVPGRGEMER